MSRILLISMLACLLTACGQTGPLYLPSEETTAPPPPDVVNEQPADATVTPAEGEAR